MKLGIQVAAVVLLTAAILSCSAQKPEGGDATTMATPHGDKELPPPGDTYEVVGWAEGLGAT